MLCQWLFCAMVLQIVTAQYFQPPFTTAVQDNNPGSYYNLALVPPNSPEISKKNLPKNGIPGKFYPGIGFVPDSEEEQEDDDEETSAEEDSTEMSTDAPKEKRKKKKNKKGNNKDKESDEDKVTLYVLPQGQQRAFGPPYLYGSPYGDRRPYLYGGYPRNQFLG